MYLFSTTNTDAGAYLTSITAGNTTADGASLVLGIADSAYTEDAVNVNEGNKGSTIYLALQRSAADKGNTQNILPASLIGQGSLLVISLAVLTAAVAVIIGFIKKKKENTSTKEN